MVWAVKIFMRSPGAKRLGIAVTSLILPPFTIGFPQIRKSKYSVHTRQMHYMRCAKMQRLSLRQTDRTVTDAFSSVCPFLSTVVHPGAALSTFKIPYIHNLFQNGAATLSGLVEMFHQRQKRGEYPKGEITFIMVSGDGGMDIGMGSALGTAIRNERLIIFEYDNGGYMNTGFPVKRAGR